VGSSNGWLTAGNLRPGAATYYESTLSNPASIGTIYIQPFVNQNLGCSSQDCFNHINCYEIATISHTSSTRNYFICIDSCKKTINNGLTDLHIEQPYYNRVEDSLGIIQIEEKPEVSINDEINNFENAVFITNMIIQDSTLLESDSIKNIYQSFRDNVGYYYATISNKLEEDADYDEIQELIAQTPNGNEIETNTVKYLSIMNQLTHDSTYNISTGMYDTISELAHKCYLTGGSLVKNARILLGIIDNEFLPDIEDCDLAGRSIGEDIVYDTISQEHIITNVINNKFEVFPNPANEEINFIWSQQNNINGGEELVNELIIYDILGKVYAKTIMNNNYTSLSTKNWPEGIYICKNQYENYLGKFIVVHNH
jgi:hypothetical protein